MEQKQTLAKAYKKMAQLLREAEQERQAQEAQKTNSANSAQTGSVLKTAGCGCV